jgi:hypothetical protein
MGRCFLASRAVLSVSDEFPMFLFLCTASSIGPGKGQSKRWKRASTIAKPSVNSKGLPIDGPNPDDVCQVRPGWTSARQQTPQHPVVVHCYTATCGLVRPARPSALPTVHTRTQGALGDCWFLSAISCVALKPELLDRVFVKADPDKGFYVVRFFKDGVWRQVRGCVRGRWMRVPNTIMIAEGQGSMACLRCTCVTRVSVCFSGGRRRLLPHGRARLLLCALEERGPGPHSPGVHAFPHV